MGRGVGGWMDGWMDAWMDGWLSQVKDCLQQSKKQIVTNFVFLLSFDINVI